MTEVVCEVCQKGSVWKERDGQHYTSPLMNVAGKKVHRCCIKKYIDHRRAPDGKIQLRVKPKFAGVPLWQRAIAWLTFGKVELWMRGNK